MFVDRLLASHGRRSGARALVINAVLAGLAGAVGTVGAAPVAEAKGPGRTYCFYKTCHRVKTIAETKALVGRDMRIVASHYDSCKKDRFNPCGLTSSGERFAPERPDNAASPILPDGTVALVWSKVSKEALVIRINNAGPYWGNRKLDLSRAAARKLGIGGVGEVTLRVLKAPTAAEARYSKNRRYEPVPGPIGQFASLDEAHGALSIMVAQGTPTTVALAELAKPQATDPAVDLGSQYATPLVPRFAIPKGALAAALIAQSTIEQRVVTASVPPSTPIAEATPKIATAKAVPPRRTRVRVMEVKPRELDALEMVAALVTSIIEPVKADRPASKERKVAAPAKAQPKRVAAVKVPQSKPVARAVPRETPRVAVAKAPPIEEFRAGFTTYAEERYRKPVKVASLAKVKVAAKQTSKANTGGEAAVASAKPVKQASVAKGKKQAALKKAGGWQSSAVFDVPRAAPALTGPHPRVPAGEMKDDTERDRGPRIRVLPSALV